MNFNEMMGELRGAIDRRDWTAAGAVIWHMRTQYPNEYNNQVAHTLATRLQRAGYPMSLATAQRLAALEEWAMSLTGEDREILARLMERGFASSLAHPPSDLGGLDVSILDWDIINMSLNDRRDEIPQWQVRKEMRDVIWLALQS